MIVYVIGIWDEDNTVYVSKYGGLSPILHDAMFWKNIKDIPPIHPIMNWLPVFVVEDLMDEEQFLLLMR